MTNSLISIGKYVPYYKWENNYKKDVRLLSQICFTGNGEHAQNELNMESPNKVRYIPQEHRKYEQSRHFSIELY